MPRLPAIRITSALASQNLASLQVLDRSQKRRFPYRTLVDGRLIEVDRGVFSPHHFSGWRFFHPHLPRTCGPVLDMGCGTGIGALAWLDRGATSVLAVDITAAAVRNAERNAQRFAPGRMRCLRSDLFQRISLRHKFAAIYWNYPFLQQPTTYRYDSDLERGLFDPGYRLLARFLLGARRRLLPGGKIVLGWGEPANTPRLMELSARLDLRVRVIASNQLPEMRFDLYQLTPRSIQ